ncbi:endonuclease NucS [Bifidobacterium stellenboschense]|uniref:Endonuclease NucS n=1 Tax=Bifidobacterium stellenboschense TaxID=762211 RepID=A0A087DN80_9BIFI|nr:endonuclease NucS [Bifidobacterium stellenboschense]KFI96980.1 putative nuclease of the RecB family [Bifidobacterium stellenboschense]
MRILVADCSAEYSGRLNASLPFARRVLLIKADNSLLIFSELGSYKPLNWMTAPCTIREIVPDTGVRDGDDITDGEHDGPVPQKVLRVTADKSSDILEVTLYHVYSDESYDLGVDPGLVKDGVEDHLQRYLAEQIHRIGEGAKLVRREYPTAIGPVDIMALNADGEHVAIEIKRHGGIDGVEQLTRYCELLNRDPLLAPVHGIFAAQTITPQARVLAEDRGFRCLILDYEEMKGTEDDSLRLF